MPDDASRATTRVVVTAVSARAMADSAARAGYAVTALDAFADLDQHATVDARRVRANPGARFSAGAAARASRDIPCDAVAYGSSFENHPRAVRALARGRALWGNPPATLDRVRDPARLADALGRRGLPAPRVQCRVGGSLDTSCEWLIKPRSSGGGSGIRVARRGECVARGYYAQERFDGVPGSVTFVAAAGTVRVLGTTRQLIGDPAFGGTGFRYVGSLLLPPGPLTTLATRLAQVVAEEFGLVGVNGIDFVVRAGVPVAIEVNPRWCASLELVERATGEAVFAAHADACSLGSVGSPPPSDRATPNVLGKAIVYAQHDTVCGDTRAWLHRPDVRDVPQPGSLIPARRPICTVFASGRDTASCHEALRARATAIRETLAPWATVPA